MDSEQSTFCERHAFTGGNDKVIEHSHINQRKRIAQSSSERLLGVTRLGDTRGWL
jgi:hypothetical protein